MESDVSNKIDGESNGHQSRSHRDRVKINAPIINKTKDSGIDRKDTAYSRNDGTVVWSEQDEYDDHTQQSKPDSLFCDWWNSQQLKTIKVIP